DPHAAPGARRRAGDPVRGAVAPAWRPARLPPAAAWRRMRAWTRPPPPTRPASSTASSTRATTCTATCRWARSASCWRDRDSFAWIGLYEPDDGVLERLQEQFGLHDLAIEDAHKAHQRPKLEGY